MTRKRSRRIGQRTAIALALVLFVIVTSIVIWRRSIGLAHAREFARLETRRNELLSERTGLEGDIRDASSNRNIVQQAQRRLGMQVASDVQVRSVLRDARNTNNRDSER